MQQIHFSPTILVIQITFDGKIGVFMSAENKIVNLEVTINEKRELEEQLKKEIEQSGKFRLNNILRHLVDHEMQLVETDRRFLRMEAMMKELQKYVLEK